MSGTNYNERLFLCAKNNTECATQLRHGNPWSRNDSSIFMTFFETFIGVISSITTNVQSSTFNVAPIKVIKVRMILNVGNILLRYQVLSVEACILGTGQGKGGGILLACCGTSILTYYLNWFPVSYVRHWWTKWSHWTSLMYLITKWHYFVVLCFVLIISTICECMDVASYSNPSGLLYLPCDNRMITLVTVMASAMLWVKRPIPNHNKPCVCLFDYNLIPHPITD